ncbi:MAG: hypothetical protein RLZ75_362 [Pseudomonadota bacterium]
MADFSYVATDGTAQSHSATVTVNVAAANDSSTVSFIITGSAIQNQTLTATNSLTDSDGLVVIACQWLARVLLFKPVTLINKVLMKKCLALRLIR